MVISYQSVILLKCFLPQIIINIMAEEKDDDIVFFT